jgi:hypothetical protein
MFERPIPIQRAASFADAWAAKAHAVLKGVCFDWWKLLTVRMRAKLSAAGHTLPKSGLVPRRATSHAAAHQIQAW